MERHQCEGIWKQAKGDSMNVGGTVLQAFICPSDPSVVNANTYGGCGVMQGQYIQRDGGASLHATWKVGDHEWSPLKREDFGDTLRATVHFRRRAIDVPPAVGWADHLDRQVGHHQPEARWLARRQAGPLDDARVG